MPREAQDMTRVSGPNPWYYCARYYDPSAGRFLSEDPLSFLGGLNLYRYVRSDPVNWVDPLGLGRSKEQCAKDLANIVRKVGLLAKEIAKYDPVVDGQGGLNWKPGGHYHEIGELKDGIWKDVANYLDKCRGDGNGPIPPCVFDTLRKHVAPPVLAPNPGVPTQYELDMLAEAARDRYNFWRTILEGDTALLAAVGGFATAPSLGGVLVLAPAF